MREETGTKPKVRSQEDECGKNARRWVEMVKMGRSIRDSTFL